MDFLKRLEICYMEEVKMKKKLLGLGIGLISLLGITCTTYASNAIKVTYNNKVIQLTEKVGTPYIDNSRVFIPLRAISEGMGKHVSWNGTTGIISIYDSNTLVLIDTECNVITVNGSLKATGVSTSIRSGVTYVPLRIVSECLGAQVNWDSSSKLISITANNSNVPTAKVSYNDMVPGQKYDITDVISNVSQDMNSLQMIAELSTKGDVKTIKVMKGDTITGVNYSTGEDLNIKIDALGWANERKMSVALRVSNLEADTLRIFYLLNGTLIGTDFAPVHGRDTYHGKNYYLFGDGLAETPSRLLAATHIGIAAAYTGEMVIIENPVTTPILNIYSK